MVAPVYSKYPPGIWELAKQGMLASVAREREGKKKKTGEMIIETAWMGWKNKA